MLKRTATALLLAATMLAPPAQADTKVIRAAHMIDVVAGTETGDPQVVVVDGRIAAVGRKGDPVPEGATVIDLGARTMLPGLIDMHVHLTSAPEFSGYRELEMTDSFWPVLGTANARRTLQAGFTTVRNVGSAHYDDVGLKQAIERGTVDGPRIVPAGYALGATGGHCDDTAALPPRFAGVDQASVADSPDGYRRAVRTMRKYGAQVIKICPTGGVLSKTDKVDSQQMSLDEITAVTDEAHRLGMRVAAHAHSTRGINDALRGHVDTIEHASLADAESFRLAKANGAWLDMDIYNDDFILGEGAKMGMFPESLAKEKAIGLKQRQTFRAAHAAGVKLLFGTDAGVYPHGDNARQFAKMVEWGMTPIEAIQAATRNAAEALDHDPDVGAIAPGRLADIIAVDGDPLQDVRQLEAVRFVMKGGEVVKGP